MGSNLGTVPDLHFTRHLDDLYPDLQQLVEASDAVTELVTTRGWTVLLEMLDAEITAIDRVLDSGRVLDSRADYASKHGRRGGLRGAMDAVEALRARAESRLEEQRRRHERDAEPSLTGR